jgi:hypothetical protein
MPAYGDRSPLQVGPRGLNAQALTVKAPAIQRYGGLQGSRGGPLSMICTKPAQ